MSDPFDDEDDAFFANLDLGQIEAVEAKAIESSQAQAPRQNAPQAQAGPSKLIAPHQRVSNRYHHTVAAPRSTPLAASSSKFTRQYEPRPLNTEPRAGGLGIGAFGFGDGGKHHVGNNPQRVIDSAKERRRYWNLHPGDRDEEKEEDYPDVTVDASGQYGLAPGPADTSMEQDEDEVVDTHAPGANAESLGMKAALARNGETSGRGNTAGALARRRAMEAAAKLQTPEFQAQAPPPTMKRHPSGPPVQLVPDNQQPQAGPSRLPMAPTRTLSRAASLGAQVHSRLTGARVPSLAPISSQSSPSSGSQPSASQGALARRTAVELDEERRKREALERQLKDLQAQMDKEKADKGKEKAKVPAQKHLADGMEVDVEPGEDLQAKLQAIQTELWKARGEAANIRRHQREDEMRHQDEAAKYKQKLVEMERRLAERDREAAAKVESVKSQAVFATHAAHNSVARNRSRLESQRPETPSVGVFNGSPRRRQQQQASQPQQTTPTKSTNKGKGKAAVPPPPKFNGLSNAFTTSPTRAKRARTNAETPAIGPDHEMEGLGDDGGMVGVASEAGRRTPMRSPSASPSKLNAHPPGPLGDDEAGDVVEVEMDSDTAPLDQKAELVHHLFNHVTLPVFELPDRPGVIAQPTIYRILQYSPADRAAEYADHCSQLLRACGDVSSSLEDLVTEVTAALQGVLEIVTAQFAANKERPDEIAALSSILGIFARTLRLFPDLFRSIGLALVPQLALVVSDVLSISASQRIASIIDQAVQKGWEERHNVPFIAVLADRFVDLCEAVCWLDGNDWKGTELIDIIVSLSDPAQHPLSVKRSIDLFYLASCRSENFRPLMMRTQYLLSDREPMDQPILERMGRYLITPHPDLLPAEILDSSIKIVRAISMLSISDPDAVVLIGERSIIVPALLSVLHRESTKVWGLHIETYSVYDALELISPTLFLLHHLTYPSPIQLRPRPYVYPSSQSQNGSQAASQPQRQVLHVEPDPEVTLAGDSPQGINLAAKLASASALKDFNGLQHVFVSALGAMAYADIDLEGMLQEETERLEWELEMEEMEEEVDEMRKRQVSNEVKWRRERERALDLRSIQYLSQDLLEAVIEGPEGDAIYELYAVDDEEGGEEGEGLSGAHDAETDIAKGKGGGDAEGRRGGGEDVGDEEYGYAPMEEE